MWQRCLHSDGEGVRQLAEEQAVTVLVGAMQPGVPE
jgi:hypothetical protein